MKDNKIPWKYCIQITSSETNTTLQAYYGWGVKWIEELVNIFIGSAKNHPEFVSIANTEIFTIKVSDSRLSHHIQIAEPMTSVHILGEPKPKANGLSS